VVEAVTEKVDMSRFQLISSAVALGAVCGLTVSGCSSELELQTDAGACDGSNCGESSDDGPGGARTVRTLPDGGTEYVDGGPGPACSDGVDNDGDGRTDLDDRDCLATFDDSESGDQGGDAGTADETDDSEDSFSVAYRVNAGGSPISADPDWEADDDSNRSPYVSGAGQQFGSASSSNPEIEVDESVDADVPSEIFENTRWDGEGESGGSGEMVYEFDVEEGTHRVHLYFCETWEGASNGTRVFDVEINGETVLDDVDMIEEAGGFTAFVETFEVETSGGDEDLAVRFLHESNNPMVAGLEVESGP